MKFFLPFVIGLMVVAVFFRQDAVLTVIYLLVGVYFGGRWWSEHALRSIQIKRHYPDRVFLNQKIPVKLELFNQSILPAIWLQIHEQLPLQLISPAFIEQVISVRPKSHTSIEYELTGRKRGYYAIGPIKLLSGDLLGMIPDQEITVETQHLTVYPQIVPMRGVNLDSHSPFGELRSANPMFEDPNRPIGKREYRSGDSLRMVDWKTSAVVGRLHVKTFQPSKALETVVCLDMDQDDYESHTRFDLTEVAVVAAASCANWIANKKQPVGLLTNGHDPLTAANFQPITPRKGNHSLMAILDVLARVEMQQNLSFIELVRNEMAHLAWGTTMILVTGTYSDDLQALIFQAQRMGLSIALLVVGLIPNMQEVYQRGRHYHFRVWNILHQDDLEIMV